VVASLPAIFSEYFNYLVISIGGTLAKPSMSMLTFEHPLSVPMCVTSATAEKGQGTYKKGQLHII
jgi:hypothetical protein